MSSWYWNSWLWWTPLIISLYCGTTNRIGDIYLRVSVYVLQLIPLTSHSIRQSILYESRDLTIPLFSDTICCNIPTMLDLVVMSSGLYNEHFPSTPSEILQLATQAKVLQSATETKEAELSHTWIVSYSKAWHATCNLIGQKLEKLLVYLCM